MWKIKFPSEGDAVTIEPIENLNRTVGLVS